MTREEAIEILIAVAVCESPILSCESCARCLGIGTDCTHPTDHEIEEAVLLLKGASKDMAISALRQQEHPRWISVKDYLPEEGKIVMVHQIYSWERQEDGAAITIGRLRPSKEGEAMLWQFQHYRPDFRNWNCIDNDIICPGNEYVTHWKPIPQRPEEERYGTE